MIRLVFYLFAAFVTSGMAEDFGEMKAWVRNADDNSLTQVTMSVPVPSGRQVLVRVAATAINRADILQRRGKYNPPPGATAVLGLEAAGTVAALGPDCTSLKVGDDVMVLLSGGGYAEYCVVDERHAVVVQGFPIAQSAGIMEAWITAFQLLDRIAQAKSGHRVLLHAGGSGVGHALIQLAKDRGCHVVVTAGSEAKLEMAKQLGADGALNRHEEWAGAALKQYGESSFDVILDCVGASYWETHAKLLAVDGAWVLYGLLGGAHVDGDILAKILRKRARLQGTTLRSRDDDYKAELVADFAAAVPQKLFSSTFKLPVDRTFSFSELPAAHAHVESNASCGKVLVSVGAARDNTEL